MAAADSIGQACAVDGCACIAKTAGLCAKHYQRRRKYGTTGPRSMCCEHCRREFLSEHQRRYCCESCMWAFHSRKRGSVPKEEYLAAVVNRAHGFRCDHCGKETHRRTSSSNRSAGYANRWCSMACRVEQAAILREQAEQEARKRRACRALSKTLAKLAVLKTPMVEPPTCACTACGTAYIKGRSRSGLCVACAEEIRKIKQRAQNARRRKTPNGRAAKLRAKSIRRARQRIHAEAIDPIALFERDRWRCQLCGVHTPKKLRGTYEPHAPEVDHIITLNDGGMHTWANVQCACRACNIRKGARSFGQIGLGL